MHARFRRRPPSDFTAGRLSNFLHMHDDLLAEPLKIRDGVLLVPPAAGLGVEIDHHKLARYRTDR